MWVYLNTAFISIVQHKQNPDLLHVRARIEGDLERALGVPSSAVIETPAGDYRYRTDISRERLAGKLAGAVDGIDYTNFKASIPDHDRHDAYLACWSAMKHHQDQSKS